MNTISVRNVHQALPVACVALKSAGVPRPSRYGDVLVAQQPVTTCYAHPWEKVMFHAERDANPFLHFADALYHLGGRRDVAYLARYGNRMRTFSDDGETYHGAYGYRWRHSPQGGVMNLAEGPRMDQLKVLANTLRENPDDRRAVLQTWDARADLGKISKDIPCNVTMKFQVTTEGELDLVVFNRSNDIVWGCYGANAVQFAYLQEYVATRAGYRMGRYWQVSCDWHGYASTFQPLYDAFVRSGRITADNDMDEQPCPYEDGQVEAHLLMQPDTDPDEWDRSLQRFLTKDGRAPVEGVWCDPFFPDVALPIVRAHDVWKDSKDGEGALRALERCESTDWRLACSEWVMRRMAKREKSLPEMNGHWVEEQP